MIMPTKTFAKVRQESRRATKNGYAPSGNTNLMLHTLICYVKQCKLKNKNVPSLILRAHADQKE